MVYYLLSKSKTAQNVFLLGASYYFYANFEPKYLVLLVGMTFVSYISGQLLTKIKSNSLRKKVLMLSVIAILAPLLGYKYLNFFNLMISDFLQVINLNFEVGFIKLLLPVGISFFTFQAIGYVVDVYKGKIQAENDLLHYALFLGFFPQIASGPIGRANALLPQIKEKRNVDSNNVSKGFNYLIWGYFLKLVIADRAAIYVNAVFNNYAEHTGTSLILATFIYSIQIYGDFAGYSFMALGTAKMMGIDLINNFNRPYFAVNVSDFWRRWHISLSTWFRDYIYIPLGGNRVSSKRHNMNIMLTFLVSGIWHGAAYNFILWGGLHGIFQVVGKYTASYQDKILSFFRIKSTSVAFKFINICITFVIVSYAWMIFRVPNISDIWNITITYFSLGKVFIDIPTLFYLSIGLLILFVKDFIDEYFAKLAIGKLSKINIIFLTLLIVLILGIGVLDSNEFIYFAF